MRQGYAACRADEQRREDRAAAEAAQRDAVSDSLAGDEGQQGPDRVRGAVLNQRAQRGLTGKKHLIRALPGGLGVADCQARDGQAGQREYQQRLPFGQAVQTAGYPADSPAGERCGRPDQHGPSELGCIWSAEVRQTRDGEGKRAQAGPGVQADKDQGPHTCGQQAWQQDDLQHRTAQAGRLHQQERAQNG